MFTRVLVATDLSPGAEKLLVCLEELKHLGTEELVLVWVTEGDPDDPALRKRQTEQLDQLEREKEQLETMGFTVMVSAPMGRPAEGIVQAAHDHSASLILISSRGRNTFRDLFLGSTVSDVIRLTDIPTLIERVERFEELEMEACRLAYQRKFERVLLATDFSEAAHDAEALMKQLASHAQKVIVTSVVDRGSTEQEVERHLREVGQRLQQVKTSLARWGASTVEIYPRIGIASNSIIQVAEQEDVTLIVMGTRGRGRLGGLYLGSTAEAVARRSRRPVLLMPFPRN